MSNNLGKSYDVLCSTTYVHLTPEHTRYIMEARAWWKSQLLILKTYETDVLNRLLGTLMLWKSTKVTVGSLGSHGRTHSAPWFCHICCWMMSKCVLCIPGKRNAGLPTCRYISKYTSWRCAEQLKREEFVYFQVCRKNKSLFHTVGKVFCVLQYEKSCGTVSWHG